MSSILRALKKLEREQTPPIRAANRIETGRTALTGTPPGHRKRGIWGGAIIAGILLAAAGFLFYANRGRVPLTLFGPPPSGPENAEPGAAAPAAQETGIHPEKRAGAPSPPAGRRGDRPLHGSIPEAGAKDLSSRAAAVTAPGSGTSAANAPGDRPHSPEAGFSRRSEPHRSAGLSRIPPPYPDRTVDGSARALSVNETPAESTELLQRPDLGLQAISWSENRRLRIAVINNRIIREGEKVAEFNVYRINADDVLLEGGGSIWRLAFKPR